MMLIVILFTQKMEWVEPADIFGGQAARKKL
jgi:hypothetical protein